MFKDFVQKKISDKTLVKFLDGRSKKGIGNKLIEEHKAHNKEVWKLHSSKFTGSDGYIEYQSKMDGIWYGKKRKFWEMIPVLKCGSKDKSIHADYNSCEVIALYNSLLSIGKKDAFYDLLAYFEGQGITSKGYFGTSILALKKYLDETKVDNSLVYNQEGNAKIADLEKKYKALIITVYNDVRDITRMIHTMCITKDSGGMHLHNSYTKNIITGKTVDEIVKIYGDGNARLISVIGVGKV